MSDIFISIYDEVYLKVVSERHIEQELSDHFTFKVPGYKFMPTYKAGAWNGDIKLYNTKTKLIYRGLLEEVRDFAYNREYNIVEEDMFSSTEFSIAEAEEFLKELNLPLTPRDYQLKAFITAIRNNRQLILSPTACHAENDEVMMDDGTWKKIQEIKINDHVIGIDGNSKKVLNIYSGEDELFDIVPRNNRSKITVTKEHLLPIKYTDSNKKYPYGKFQEKDYIKYMSVDDYIQSSKSHKHVSTIFYNNNVIEYKNSIDPKINLTPYFIGVYLGDGTTNYPEITGLDDAIINEVKFHCEKFGLNYNTRQRYGHKLSQTTKKIRNPIFSEFDKLGLHFGNIKNKLKCEDRFVPKEILTSSVNFRREVLAGLIDSDGHLSNKTSYELTFKSLRLRNDIVKLATSLGLVTSQSTKYNKKYNRNYYRVCIMGDIHTIPARVNRKKAYIRPSKKDPYRSKFDVIPVGKNKYYGIQVEDRLYISNGGMITHNSGKSFLIYLLCRYYNVKTLIVVPTTTLIHQMNQDFKSYGYERDCHKIFSGREKDSAENIFVSTWQSIFNMPKNWFDKFDLVIVDECHLAKSNSLVKIMKNLTSCKYRFGFTGTLDGTQTNELVIKGLFGEINRVITTSELIEQKHLADFKIKCLLLRYPDEVKKIVKTFNYPQEIEHIVTNKKRNNFIKNLSLSLEGNTLILFQFVDKHGSVLYDMIKNSTSRPVYFVHGGVDGEIRNSIRGEVEKASDAIIIASVQTFSTGINIKSLKNIIFASPSKSRVRTLQSIGRVLRKSENKTDSTLFDIADDFSWKKKANYTLIHFMERLKIYGKEKFNYKIYNIEVK